MYSHLLIQNNTTYVIQCTAVLYFATAHVQHEPGNIEYISVLFFVLQCKISSHNPYPYVVWCTCLYIVYQHTSLCNIYCTAVPRYSACIQHCNVQTIVCTSLLMYHCTKGIYSVTLLCRTVHQYRHTYIQNKLYLTAVPAIVQSKYWKLKYLLYRTHIFQKFKKLYCGNCTWNSYMYVVLLYLTPPSYKMKRELC